MPSFPMARRSRSVTCSRTASPAVVVEQLVHSLEAVEVEQGDAEGAAVGAFGSFAQAGRRTAGGWRGR